MLLATSRDVAGLPLCARKSFAALETLCAAAMAPNTESPTILSFRFVGSLVICHPSVARLRLLDREAPFLGRSRASALHL